MSAIDALNRARETIRDEDAPQEAEAREFSLEPDEILAIGRAGYQEGSPISVTINGLLSGGTITVQTVGVPPPLKAQPQEDEKAPIVRMNPAPYAG